MALKRLTPLPAGDRNEKATSGRILYVEDEDLNWEVAELALRGQFHLDRARTDREAFELVATKEYDLILMDVQLSGSRLNGIEVTRVLKGLYEGDLPSYAEGIRCKDAPIIFVTAYTARYNKAELIAHGGSELIAKPVDFVRLSLAISRLVVRNAVSTL